MSQRSGFTLVEMMIAVVASFIVFMAAAIVLTYGQRAWDQAAAKAELQREVSNSILAITTPIKAAKSVHITGSGKSIKIYHDVGWTRYYFVQGQHDLRYHTDGAEPITLIDGIVEDVEFAVDAENPNKIHIAVILSKDQVRTQLVTTVAMRNF